MSELAFLKLGGSLITDKARPYTARPEHLQRLAAEIAQALAGRPDLRLLVGHGSGSFGHQAAAPYGTRQGVHSADQWRGYAHVAAAAARLNRIVTDVLLEAGVPVLSIQPSASARCRDGVLRHLAIEPIYEALDHGLVPLVYGDVAFDSVRGGTIISTEDLFVYLTDVLGPQRILLVGAEAGVLDGQGRTVAHISPASLSALRAVLGGSASVDVTGGMADKVARMVALVERYPALCVRIFSGLEPDLVRRALVDPSFAPGTLISAPPLFP